MLRTLYKSKRQALTNDEVDALSLEIANRTLQLPIWDQSSFHVFLPIERHKEINTEFLLHILSGRDKRIVISQADFETRHMTHFLLDEHTRIKPNDYGIPEPVDGIEVPVSKIEVVFVPLLAFDQNGQRVGYGKGFYDNFLLQCKPGTVKVGLSFFEAESDISDVYPGDVKLDFCVTPAQVYAF